MWAGSELVSPLPQGHSSSPTPSWPFSGGSRFFTWSLRWASTTETDAFPSGGKSAQFSKVPEGFGRAGRFLQMGGRWDPLLESLRPWLSLSNNF
jgi:hypothetical protein